ncbi:MAG TPA: class I SAM-dependent methyltransferase [Polyangiaceae bacterium]|nr:class I SAM-dependent methyltransferase [Polyangiaceae bacterium]
MTTRTFEDEIRSGDRYGFGKNWLRFLELVDEARIERSTLALREALREESLAGKTFLDIGSGSGLSSLAALRLGAQVTSFDYDVNSVSCTRALRERFAPNAETWDVRQGSVLDAAFMQTLPSADVVYSWGVLHHTGDMYGAIRAAAEKVLPGGKLCLALYRQTVLCEAWKVEKRLYSRAPEPVRKLMRGAWVGKTRLAFALKGRSFSEMVASYGSKANSRGMDYYRDVDDWLGGYPYESITPEKCRAFVGELGFALVQEKAVRDGVAWALSSGCDEWLFVRQN